MTVVNPKSISGINSITTGSGSDNLLTIHTNNGTERLRIDSTGTTKIVTGIVTTLTATTGIVTTLTTNTLTANSTTKVGSGITLSPDGDISATGITTISYTGTSQYGLDVYNPTSGGSGARIRAGDDDGQYSLLVENGAGTNLFEVLAGGGGARLRSGDLSILDKISHYGDGNTFIRFPAADTVTVETSGSERARINSDGQLLVGTTETSPYSNRTLMTNKTGGNYVSVTTDSSNDCGIVFGDGTANNSANYESYIAHSNSTNDFTINVNQGNNSRYLRVKSSTGNVEIGAGNLVLASGKGIDFSATSNTSATGASMSNELLDDYEEGTWTPIISYQYGSVTSYGTQTGKYTKIGNMVYADFYISLTNKGDPSGSYSYIQGFPFNHTGSTAGVGSVYFFNNFNQNVSYVAYELGGSSPTVAWLTGIADEKNTAMNYLSGSYFTNTTTIGGQLVYRVSG